jgi:uncharacterized protein
MPIIDQTGYQPSGLLANRHISTIVPNLLRFTFGVNYDRQRILTPDGDFLDLDWSRVGSKRLVLLSHGLEANSKATYVLGMVKHFNSLGYDTLAWNFRSCSGEVNWTVPFYHPGQTDDYQLVLDTAMATGQYEEIYLIGFSLGGAITLRYLGEQAGQVNSLVKKAVVFSVPVDLAASAKHLGEGSQALYARAFLIKYRNKMLLKEKRHPGKYDMDAWNRIQSLIDFDDTFSAPWCGLENAAAFYKAYSPRPLLPEISIPTLIVNAMNDPFLPADCFPFDEARHSAILHLEVPELGGHVGFMAFNRKGVYWSEERAQEFIEQG